MTDYPLSRIGDPHASPAVGVLQRTQAVEKQMGKLNANLGVSTQI
jgi:hypothetical protein